MSGSLGFRISLADLIPADYRPAGVDQPLRSRLRNMIKVWENDEDAVYDSL